MGSLTCTVFECDEGMCTWVKGRRFSPGPAAGLQSWLVLATPTFCTLEHKRFFLEIFFFWARVFVFQITHVMLTFKQGMSKYNKFHNEVWDDIRISKIWISDKWRKNWMRTVFIRIRNPGYVFFLACGGVQVTELSRLHGLTHTNWLLRDLWQWHFFGLCIYMYSSLFTKNLGKSVSLSEDTGIYLFTYLFI